MRTESSQAERLPRSTSRLCLAVSPGNQDGDGYRKSAMLLVSWQLRGGELFTCPISRPIGSETTPTRCTWRRQDLDSGRRIVHTHQTSFTQQSSEMTRRRAEARPRQVSCSLSVSAAVTLTEFDQLVLIKKLFFPLKEMKDEEQINAQTQADQKILNVTLK